MAAAPGKLLRLGKEDLERLVEPFERLGCHLLKNIEKPEARIACDQHMETWWLMQRVLQDRRTAPAARLREPPADGELRVPPTPSCASCSSCLEERAGSWLGGGCSVPGGRTPAPEQHTLPAVARATAACFCDMWVATMDGHGLPATHTSQSRRPSLEQRPAKVVSAPAPGTEHPPRAMLALHEVEHLDHLVYRSRHLVELLLQLSKLAPATSFSTGLGLEQRR